MKESAVLIVLGVLSCFWIWAALMLRQEGYAVGRRAEREGKPITSVGSRMNLLIALLSIVAYLRGGWRQLWFWNVGEAGVLTVKESAVLIAMGLLSVICIFAARVAYEKGCAAGRQDEKEGKPWW